MYPFMSNKVVLTHRSIAVRRAAHYVGAGSIPATTDRMLMPEPMQKCARMHFSVRYEISAFEFIRIQCVAPYMTCFTIISLF